MTPHDHDHVAAAGSGPQNIGNFTCPMHPEIKRAEPGKCPICGMTLVPAGGEQVQ